MPSFTTKPQGSLCVGRIKASAKAYRPARSSRCAKPGKQVAPGLMRRARSFSSAELRPIAREHQSYFGSNVAFQFGIRLKKIKYTLFRNQTAHEKNIALRQIDTLLEIGARGPACYPPEFETNRCRWHWEPSRCFPVTFPTTEDTRAKTFRARRIGRSPQESGLSATPPRPVLHERRAGCSLTTK